MKDPERPVPPPPREAADPAPDEENRSGEPGQENSARVFTLLDEAASSGEPFPGDIQRLREIAVDPGRTMEERLEAYEDIIDSEVGDTNLSRARNVEREFGIRQLFVKFDGGNPTGTQKDRIAFAQARDALRRGFDTITMATCGNYGAAMALAASSAGLRCLIYIPAGYHTRRLEEMVARGAEICTHPGDYESTVLASRDRAEREGLYDANPGGANTALQLEAYAEIAKEIYDELRDAPAAVAVPVSNGTTLAGIYKGFLSLYRRGKTSRLPRMIAGSSHGKNPIIRSFLKNLPRCENLDPRKVHETPINEPLINWHSAEGDQALEAVRATGGWARDASDRAMRAHAKLLREREGLSVLPASTAGLVVLLDRHKVEPLPGDRYVAVLTGEAGMSTLPEGSAVVYCEGAFDTPNGKTAHGLVRRTERYRVVAVVDSPMAGQDAGALLDGKANGVPLVASLEQALARGREIGTPATHFVVGLAPDGGRLGAEAREAVKQAIRSGLNVDCGLHDFLSEDGEIAGLAREHGVRIRDVRKTPPREALHFFSGKIEEVTSFRIALLGTDSAVGKRTTAWVLVDALRAAGRPAELVGTGQTAWMQGARHGIILDSLINDFVSGEIEHAIWSTWQEASPDAIVIEGQGSLMNPAYPGGFEILAAGRPHVVVLQHAPARTEYDGFPGYAMHPLDHQIQAIELLSGKPVVAVTVNHEGLRPDEIGPACAAIEHDTGLPAVDVLREGAGRLVAALQDHWLEAGGRR